MGIDQDLIDRYTDGKASKEDLQKLSVYLLLEDQSLLKKKMGADWDKLKEHPGIKAEISRSIWNQISTETQAKSRVLMPGAKLAAAGVVMLLVIAGMLLVGQGHSHLKTVETSYGEWMSVTLPDGSTAKLNARSKINFDEEWSGDEDRHVWLSGEAFFEVNKMPTGAKFLVHVDDLTIEVLGTSFNVCNRKGETEVFLEEGSIKLDLPRGDDELMRPGEKITYSETKEKIINRRESLQSQEYTSWKDGILMMKNSTAEEIMNKIIEIYGVKVEGLNKIKDKGNKTVSIPMDKLEIAIPILEGCFEMDIIQDGSSLTFIDPTSTE